MERKLETVMILYLTLPMLSMYVCMLTNLKIITMDMEHAIIHYLMSEVIKYNKSP
nr:MAG TPA: hypothetical protein [Caudoviricetes sp.]